MSITWSKPSVGWLKCNTDGASRGNPGPSSVAFCIRISEENLIYAKMKQIGYNTNIYAEALAMKEGIEYCRNNEMFPLIIETDSLFLKKVIEGDWRVPWRINSTIIRIKQALSSGEHVVTHTLREGNKVADFFANIVFDFAGTKEYTSHQDLPAKAKALVQLDKLQVPNIRLITVTNREPN